MGKRVLLVDDDSSVKSDARALKAHGVDCDFCESWEEALSLFQVNHYDVVISDYLLPGTEHGLTLLTKMRSIKPSTCLLLISAYVPAGREDDIRKTTGVLKLFRKPFDPKELAETVKKALIEIPENQTDWEAIAKATIAAGSVSADEVRQINREILKEIDEK